MVLDIVEALLKQAKSQGCLKPNNVLASTIWPLSGQGGRSVEGGGTGAKEIKSETRTILETINSLNSILYNPYFQRVTSKEQVIHF